MGQHEELKTNFLQKTIFLTQQVKQNWQRIVAFGYRPKGKVYTAPIVLINGNAGQKKLVKSLIFKEDVKSK